MFTPLPPEEFVLNEPRWRSLRVAQRREVCEEKKKKEVHSLLAASE
jgi:hypothetical protein